MALINNKPRAATILAKTEVHLAVLRKKDFRELFQEIELNKLNAELDLLNSLPCFNGMTRNALTKIRYMADINECKKGFKVMKEGNPSEHIYLIT